MSTVPLLCGMYWLPQLNNTSKLTWYSTAW